MPSYLGHRLLRLAILLPALLLVASNAAALVHAGRVESPDELLSGAWADGELNDFLLENDQIAIVISALGHHPYYGQSGGNVLDAGSSTDRIDALGELYTYFDNDWPRQAMYYQVLIVDDGAGGGPAMIRANGFDTYDTTLSVVTEYSLSDGAEHLDITTTVSNGGGGSYPNFELGDAFHWGECRKYAPGHGFDLSDTTTESWLAGTAAAVSYGYLSAHGEIWGPHGDDWSDVNVISADIGPFESVSYERDLVVGGRDVASVATIIHAIEGTPIGSAFCTVAGLPGGEPLLSATIDAFDVGGDIYLQMLTDAGGFAECTLPVGDWQLVASASGYLPAETWAIVVEGETIEWDFLLEIDDTIPPIGDTLTVIQRPLLNVPALHAPGDTLTIDCEADPGTTGWAAELVHDALSIPLTVYAATYNPATLWWRLSAVIPDALPLYELYDLRVTADSGIEDLTWNAVRLIPAFKDDYYFIHITDTHLPTHLYNDQSGAEDDSTSVLDLRAVMADINLINPEFVLLTGDFINEGELEDYLYWRYYTRSQRNLTEFEVPVFLIAGNHDIGGWVNTPPPNGTARRDWWRFFGWGRLDDPPPGAPEYTQNYSFDYGAVHYVGLEAYDNYDLWREEIYGETSFTSGQLDWLVGDLAAAAGSASEVLFYHYDFMHELDLEALGVEMALWGHVHSNQGSIHTQPYDLATNNVSRGNRAYRLVRVSSGVLAPTNTFEAGSSGRKLRVGYDPANDGTHYSVSAEIVNEQPQSFEHGQLRLLLPNENGVIEVAGGTLLQTDRTGSVQVCYVDVDIQAQGTQTVTITLDPSGVEEELPPPVLALGQNYPNPFNPQTRIHYALPCAEEARLSIFDVQGREVALLLAGTQPAGEGVVDWDGRDGTGRPAPSGVYFARLAACGELLSRKITLAR